MRWWPFGQRSPDITPTAQDGEGTGRETISVDELAKRLYGDDPVYTLGDGSSTLFTYPTFARCIEFISGNCADLIADTESLMVLDNDGKLSNSRRSKSVMDLLTHSPDGINPSHDWVEDFAADYAVYGNALAMVERRPDGVPFRLRRLRSEGAHTQETANGIVYRATDDLTGRQVVAAEADVIHVRFSRQSTMNWHGTSRQLFSPAPATLLKPSTQVGLSSDRFVRDWFRDGGNRADQAIVLNEEMSSDQLDEFRDMLRNRRSRSPIVIQGDAKVSSLSSTAQNTELAALREFQIREVARFYGVPPAVLGEGSTDKAATKAEEIGRIAWRFGLNLHVNRIISAMSFKLLSKGEKLAVDPIQLIRGDPAGLASLYTVMRTGPNGTGDMSREEARRLIGLPAEPRGGDTLPDERIWPENQPKEEAPPPAQPKKMNGSSPRGIILEDRVHG